MADQDGFWLQEGEPFFPLGTYHCHIGNWREPIDDTGLRACDMGFNWMQMWDWDWRGGLSLDREIADAFIDKSLRGAAREAAIDARIATNAANRVAFRGVAICLEGFGDATLEPLFGAPAARVKKDALPIALPTWGTAVWRVK